MAEKQGWVGEILPLPLKRGNSGLNGSNQDAMDGMLHPPGSVRFCGSHVIRDKFGQKTEDGGYEKKCRLA